MFYILLFFAEVRCYLPASRWPLSLKCCMNLFLQNASIVAVQLDLKNVFSQVEAICLFCTCITAVVDTQNKYAIKLEK